MKTAALASCFGVVAALTLGQQPPKPENQASIEGTVVSAKSGEPVRKAQIVLTGLEGPEESFDTASDDNGRFKLVQIVPGRYRLSVLKNGFIRQEYGQKTAGRPGGLLTVAAGQNLRDLNFRLVPAGVVTGRAVDEDGEPLAGVRVQLLRYSYADGKRQVVTAGGAMTDDLGQYRMFGLSPGRYYASAVYADPRDGLGSTDRSATRGASSGYAPVFYPGVSDVDQSAPILLREGEEKWGVDFKMARTRTVFVRGRIVNAAGLSGIVVVLSKRQSGGLSSLQKSYAEVRENGSFELRGVAPGSYTLKAFVGYEESVLTARQPLDVSTSDVDKVELALRPAVEVSGRIQLEGQGKAKSWDQFSPYLIPLEDPITIGDSGDASVASDGAFRFRNVVPGEYRVSFLPLPDDFFVKSVRQGNVDVLDKGLSVTGAAGNLELVMSANGGRIEGSVLNDQKKAVSGAMVVLVPEPGLRGRGDLFKATTTDQYGAFKLRGVPPGDYKLFAWEDVEVDSYKDPAVLEPYEKQGRPISVREQSQEQVELTLIPAR
jgi:carboxypeptidase family protein